jgi:predicted nucleic acid-binding Zn ribbon protein
MPLYTYNCPNEFCSTFGHMQEAVVPFEERDLQVCDICKRVLRRAAIEKTGSPKWLCSSDTASEGKPCQVED